MGVMGVIGSRESRNAGGECFLAIAHARLFAHVSPARVGVAA
jgi:hypothetical protein